MSKAQRTIAKTSMFKHKIGAAAAQTAVSVQDFARPNHDTSSSSQQYPNNKSCVWPSRLSWANYPLGYIGVISGLYSGYIGGQIGPEAAEAHNMHSLPQRIRCYGQLPLRFWSFPSPLKGKIICPSNQQHERTKSLKLSFQNKTKADKIRQPEQSGQSMVRPPLIL